MGAYIKAKFCFLTNASFHFSVACPFCGPLPPALCVSWLYYKVNITLFLNWRRSWPACIVQSLPRWDCGHRRWWRTRKHLIRPLHVHHPLPCEPFLQRHRDRYQGKMNGMIKREMKENVPHQWRPIKLSRVLDLIHSRWASGRRSPKFRERVYKSKLQTVLWRIQPFSHILGSGTCGFSYLWSHWSRGPQTLPCTH